MTSFKSMFLVFSAPAPSSLFDCFLVLTELNFLDSLLLLAAVLRDLERYMLLTDIYISSRGGSALPPPSVTIMCEP